MNLMRRSRPAALRCTNPFLRSVAACVMPLRRVGRTYWACKDDPSRRVPAHSRFPLRPKGRSEAGGGLNAPSHCAEEKVGACGKREWGGCRFSPPPALTCKGGLRRLAAFARAGGDSVGRWFAWGHASQKPDQIAHGVLRQLFDELHQCQAVFCFFKRLAPQVRRYVNNHIERHKAHDLTEMYQARDRQPSF